MFRRTVHSVEDKGLVVRGGSRSGVSQGEGTLCLHRSGSLNPCVVDQSCPAHGTMIRTLRDSNAVEVYLGVPTKSIEGRRPAHDGSE